jgi:4-hydroxy-tetrahydrodipicolinate reductase
VNDTKLRIAVVGATGKMGRTVMRFAADDEHTLVAAISTDLIGADVGTLLGEHPSGLLVADDLLTLVDAKPDVVIDFSSANAFISVAEASARAGAALVSGTTGLNDQAMDALLLTSKLIPVLWESNMSVGVHVLKELIRLALLQLNNSADIEIVETHHRFKADSPSGTAIALLDVIKSASEATTVTHGRSGRPGARIRSEVGMHAVRGGDVIGDHTVHFLCDGERLELTHRATSRDLFANGALRAACFLAGKPNGRYTLKDVLAVPELS